MKSSRSRKRAVHSVVLLLLAAGCGPGEPETHPETRPAPAGAAGVGTMPVPSGTGTTLGASGTAAPSGTAGMSGAAVGGTGVPGTAGVAGPGTSGSAGGAAGGGQSNAGSGPGSAGSAAMSGGGGTGIGHGAAGRGSVGVVAGSTAIAASPAGDSVCCQAGSCICRGEVPSELTADNGPYRPTSTQGRLGTVYYPMNADPPFAALAITPGLLNTGWEMNSWGEFYASWGIVTHVTNAGPGDLPETRARLLLDGIEELKAMNMEAESPLAGKLSGRYGISGYSYGGGGATIGASRTPELATSVGLAPFGGSGRNSKVPTLVICGEADAVAGCFMADSVYGGIPDDTPKIYISVPGVQHLSWFTPTAAGDGASGKYALAFQKVFLEGDARWKPLLMQRPARGEYKTNIE